MPSVDGSFYTWLAAQPAFVEVAIGVAFVVIVAPAILAAAAMAITRLEDLLVLRWAVSARGAAGRYLHPIDGLPRTSWLRPATVRRTTFNQQAYQRWTT